MQKIRLFIDMDGTLARFHDEVMYLERMYEKGFFENLKPFENMVEAVKKLMRRDTVEVFILSSTIGAQCIEEKNRWLDKYLPGIDREHRLFADGMSIPKPLLVPDASINRNSQTAKYKITISEYNILLDDYNKNLSEWKEAGGTPIKAKNNINHKGLIGELWRGDLIDITSNAEKITFGLLEKAAALSQTEERADDEDEDYEDMEM